MPNKEGNTTFDNDTQEQILDVAMRLFALKGFKSVSLKEIAKAIGIQSPSLYYYYESKDALINDVLLRYEKAHKKYNDYLRKASDSAETLDDVMDVLFNKHFMTGMDSTARLGMALALKEQHHSKPAYQAVLKNLYNEAISSVQRCFDRLIDRNIIVPSNTKTLASLFMFCTMSVNDVHIHEATDTVTPFDRTEIYSGLRTLMAAALSQGLLKAD